MCGPGPGPEFQVLPERELKIVVECSTVLSESYQSKQNLGELIKKSDSRRPNQSKKKFSRNFSDLIQISSEIVFSKL